MKILALDISSVSTGVAVINNGKLQKKSLTLIKPNIKETYGARLLFFQEEIIKQINEHTPDLIVIEDIFKGRNINTFKSLAMFRGVAIKTIFEQIKKDPISILAVKARSIMELEPTKEEAFNVIVKKYKLDFDFEEKNDIVDAIVLGLAIHTLVEQGFDERSLQNIRGTKKRKSRRNKKSV